jgi:kinetochore protein Nuf2
LTVEANNLANTITRQRGRIVQSPERLKRTIVNMGTTAAEDKKIVAANEAKIKDLEMKITACLTIERVQSLLLPDVSSC